MSNPTTDPTTLLGSLVGSLSAMKSEAATHTQLLAFEAIEAKVQALGAAVIERQAAERGRDVERKYKLNAYTAARELVAACEALNAAEVLWCDDGQCCGSGACPTCKAKEAWWSAVRKAREAGL